MPVDLTKSTVNTSGGVRGKLKFTKGQEHYAVKESTIKELEERGFIVLDKNDLVDAVAQLLSGESSRLQSLIGALNIPTVGKSPDNLLKLDANGGLEVVSTGLKAPIRVLQTTASSGTNIVFTWNATPFPDLEYSVNLTCSTALTSAWSYTIISKTVTSIEIKLQGIATASTFQLIAMGHF